MERQWWIHVIILIGTLKGCACNREYECGEVGFARTSGTMVPAAYDSNKERLTAIWLMEDKAGRPAFTNLPPEVKNITRMARLLEDMSQDVMAQLRKTRVGKRCRTEWMLRGLEKHIFPIIRFSEDFAKEMGIVRSFRCTKNSPYPNVDGSCVGEESPDMGAIGSKFLRLLGTSVGHDGFSIRGTVASDDTPLPSARQVARVVRQNLKRPDITAMFSDWSHFLQQDIYSIAESPYVEDVDCCLSPDTEDCAPIMVEEDDTDLYPHTKCLNFRRSARAQAILGHREGLSLVSTFLDAGPVYGIDNDIAFTRKTGFFGLLRGSERAESEDKKSCTAPHSYDGCFTPDEDFPVPASVRALLSLEHNRLAEALAEVNPHFDDSLLYNEARRLVIAQYAAITYGSFLPTLIGPTAMEKNLLRPLSEHPSGDTPYLREVNPGVLAAFATTAFRNPSMKHEWKLEWPDREETFGSAQYDSMKLLPYQDILASDVQRARDHGVAGYLQWRQFCEPERAVETWDDFKDTLPEEAIEQFKDVYNGAVEDVDAMVALLEVPVEGGVVGTTFACIMADQYARLRSGNRLFWENEGGQMTPEQKTEIAAASLAKLLCANLPVEAVPENSFLPVSDTNPEVKCSEVKPLNLKLWIDFSLIEPMKAVRQAEAKKAAEVASRKMVVKDKKKSTEDDTAYEEGKTNIPSQEDTKDSTVVSGGFEVKATEGQVVNSEEVGAKPGMTTTMPLHKEL